MDSASDTPVRPLIVLVEDDPWVREALIFALGIEGYDLAVFENAEALLDLPEPPSACCLVLDHNLPGISGVDALKELRHRGIDCPAILITTQPKPGVRTAAARLGARVLEKPLLGDALPALLREVLGR